MITAETPGQLIKDTRLLNNLKSRLTRLFTENLPSINDRFNYEKFPGGHPISFTKSHLALKEPYLVCEKTDGVRYLLMMPAIPGLNGIVNAEAYLIDRKYNFWKITVHVPGEVLVGDNLYDTELIFDYGTEPRLLIFDTIFCRGTCFLYNNYYERLRAAWKALVYPLRLTRSRSENSMEIYLKDFFEPKDIDYLYNQIIPSLPHESDGLIFTKVEAPYSSGTNSNIIKWKPPHLNTIDFYIKSTSEENLFELYTQNIKLDKFGEIQVRDEEQKKVIRSASNCVGECYLQNGEWKIYKLRTDKDTANNTVIAERILKSIQDNVSAEDIIEAFTTTKKLKTSNS